MAETLTKLVAGYAEKKNQNIKLIEQEARPPTSPAPPVILDMLATKSARHFDVDGMGEKVAYRDNQKSPGYDNLWPNKTSCIKGP